MSVDAIAKKKDDRPFLGRAVVSGKLRFASVSQIVIFDPEMYGGCNRRWYFIYVMGRKEEKVDFQIAGNKFASSLEMYLKTGYDALEPELRVAKHLFPAYDPARPLEVEKDLAVDVVGAIRIREALLGSLGLFGDGLDRAEAAREMRRLAGLTASDVPIIGAADFRHRRGEYVDEDGTLRREAPGHVVGETGDLKSTSRIRDHVVKKTGMVLRGYAKSTEEILSHPQMLGYGVYHANACPDLTHVRLSHVYIQRKNGLSALKRTGLLTVDEVRDRWRRVEGVVRAMEDVAAAARPEDVPASTRVCGGTFGDRPCPHAGYCDRPNMTIHDFLQLPEGDKAMGGNGLFDSLLKSDANGAAATAGFFAPPIPTLSSPLSSVPLPTEAERQAAVEAEKKRLAAEEKIVPCGAAGCGVSPAAAGWVVTERGGFIMCATCMGRGRSAAATPPPIGAVNPPDGPRPDPIAAAEPLPPQVIDTISDPEVKQRAVDHAAAVAQAAPPPLPGKEKTSGRCPAGGQKVSLTMDDLATRRGNYCTKACPSCGKPVKVEPVKEGDGYVATLKGHTMPKAEVSAPPLPSAEDRTLPLPLSQPPPIPSETPPPLPLESAVQAVAAAPALPQSTVPAVDHIDAARAALSSRDFRSAFRSLCRALADVTEQMP